MSVMAVLPQSPEDLHLPLSHFALLLPQQDRFWGPRRVSALSTARPNFAKMLR